MKTNKFLLPSIFIVLTIIAYIAASVIFCYTTKPEITEGEFPFSITYEYKGETKKLEGVYKCEYSGSDSILGQHDRYWESESIFEYDGEYDIPNTIYSDETMTLAVFERMSAGYFMGDPLYADWYTNYGLEGPTPYAEYHDYINEISVYDEDENSKEILEGIGFRIIDYSYAEPIENSFSFSGIQYEADNITIFILITLAFLLLCIIFVRKDKEYKYSMIDKLGVGFNFAVGLLAIPFISFICFLHGIFGNDNFVSQLVYNLPPFSIICLALSIVFRRKEFKKTGFVIQFAGTAIFAVYLFLDAVSGL